jgi:cysteinyl-tRNA synthetase
METANLYAVLKVSLQNGRECAKAATNLYQVQSRCGMVLRVYNTLTRQVEEFVPLHEGKVGLYTCGPTVYDFPHIGNYRAYMFGDVLKRWLRYRGYAVKHVMNLTDVDDKTIRGAQRESMPLKTFTARYERAFFEDLETLNITPADVYPKATEHIPEMVAIIRKLLEKGLAYQAGDGVYYKVRSFRGYGKLANITMGGLKEGASGRVKKDEYEKDAVNDFALWKTRDEEDGDVFWETPVGRGRPGWHIECSAMSMKHLGESFDIHTGGVDLVFPHHQNEIAQSEGATGKPFVKYWLHNEWLLVYGQKMSKSLGNFLTLRDVLAKGFDARAVRYALLAGHYRQQMNFTFDSVKAAKAAVERLDEAIRKLGEVAKEESGSFTEMMGKEAAETQKLFEEAMDNDLQISSALAAVFDWLKIVNAALDTGTIGRESAAAALGFLKKVDSVLGVMDFSEGEKLPPEMMKQAEERERLRKAGKFAEADAIRKELLAKGMRLDDTPGGVRWKKLK